MPTAASHHPADLVKRQIEAILAAWGMQADKVRTTAEVMIETDLMGVDSHGVSMLLMYDVMQRAGQINLDATPRIVRENAATALVDGDAGLGHPASVMAMELAIAKAKASGTGVVSVRNSHHFGAAGYYAELAAAQGLIAMVSSTTRLCTLVPTFGAEPILGTNPFAFSAPAGQRPPVTLDIATSVVAANKVKVYALNGKDIPAGWVVDGNGRTMTSSADAYRMLFDMPDGGLTPIGGDGMTLGGHKGYGLAVFAQILAGTLGGGSFSPIRNLTQKPGEPDNIGHFFMVIDPTVFRPFDEFAADMDGLVDRLHATRRAEPEQPVLLPGEPERQARAERLARGIPIAPALAEALRQIASAAGAPFLLDDAIAGTPAPLLANPS